MLNHRRPPEIWRDTWPQAHPPTTGALLPVPGPGAAKVPRPGRMQHRPGATRFQDLATWPSSTTCPRAFRHLLLPIVPSRCGWSWNNATTLPQWAAGPGTGPLRESLDNARNSTITCVQSAHCMPTYRTIVLDSAVYDAMSPLRS